MAAYLVEDTFLRWRMGRGRVAPFIRCPYATGDSALAFWLGSCNWKRLKRSCKRSTEFIVSPKKVVGCRGGSRYVEGCWELLILYFANSQFEYFAFWKFKVLEMPNLNFHNFQNSNCQMIKLEMLNWENTNLQM